jgi:hypothetical protein
MTWPSASRWRRLDAATADVLAHVQPLPEAGQEWRPAVGAWNAREVLEHLVITEELVFSQYPAHGAPRALREWWLVRLMMAVSASGLRVRVPLRELAPSGTLSVSEASLRWHAVRDRLRDAAATAARATPHVALLHHPAAGPFSWAGGLDFLTAHIRHHERQLRRIAQARRAAGSR